MFNGITQDCYMDMLNEGQRIQLYSELAQNVRQFQVTSCSMVYNS